jgi:TnpA family transposase
MKKFTHILPVYSKNEANESAISACVVAQGTGSDIHRMKDISDIKQHELESASNDFIRYKTLSEANDEIMNKVEKLPIFEKYTLADYGIHASVDGQKLETKYNTIKARHSSKYFGFGKGVSAYTLFANCLPLCSKIIGANEHESHYLFDILNSNTSDVKISAVSGDMHSINRLNFALLHFFGYRFMPRFTQLDKKAKTNLVSFENFEEYEHYTVKPSKKVNTKLIIKEWDNILKILTTLGLKKNTQSHIVRKLSSYQSNDTLRALIELNKIVMSLYILDYIDDEQMRKNVHRSLNREESYHQLRSAIAKVSSRKLIGKTEKELTINNECARLMSNCIIFYNASILSGLYNYYKKNNMKEECEKIIRFSPVAWQHINLIGMYEFNKSGGTLDLQGIIDSLINDPKIDLSAVA